MNVATEAVVDVPEADPAEVFDYVTDPAAAAEFFTGYGPIPAIERVDMFDGATPAVGAARRIVLTDGSQLREEILELERPRRHAYRVTGYQGLFRRLTSAGEGQWTLTPQGSGTRIVWKYTYALTSPLAWPLALPLVHLLMRGAMQRALGRIGAHFASRTTG